MALKKMCVLEDRECIGCGECDRCDLDPDKICDNCMKCVKGDADFSAITISGIELENEKDDDHDECDCGHDHCHCGHDHHHHH